MSGIVYLINSIEIFLLLSILGRMAIFDKKMEASFPKPREQIYVETDGLTITENGMKSICSKLNEYNMYSNLQIEEICTIFENHVKNSPHVRWVNDIKLEFNGVLYKFNDKLNN